MTLSEFKAWFEGFTEDMDGAPTAKQFKKIKAKVADIDGAPVPIHIFRDRYWLPNWPNRERFGEPWITCTDGTNEQVWDAGKAWASLGKAEAAA
jgi:hypothetical protein